MIFPDSLLAHQYLDGLHGIEIGASAHNPFNIPQCIYVDFTDSMETKFKKEEIKLCGRAQGVNLVAWANDLPFKDATLDYVLTSHVIEHCWDALGTITEWLRVLRRGGIIFAIIPHPDRTFDRGRELTTLEELINRASGLCVPPKWNVNRHYSVWMPEDWKRIAAYFGCDLLELHETDDKVGNGFTVVMEKIK